MTSLELSQSTQLTNEPLSLSNDLVKPEPVEMPQQSQSQQQQQHHQQHQTVSQEKHQHPLHQYDWSLMSKFFESCVGKLKEQNSKWQPSEWSNLNPMPSTLSWEQKYDWPNPFVLSQKQRVYESFARLALESGEPMILMPNFDYGDILNFERFLQALKQDGVNAIGKYKQYLSNKDMRKFEVDLAIVHAKYGVLLFEVKECEHFDNKRKSKAKAQLNNARSCFESLGRLVAEAKGWGYSEAHIQVTEFVVLPNVLERPSNKQNSNNSMLHSQSVLSNFGSSISSRNSRQLNYLIKSDLENSVEFAKWWTKYVVEPKVQQQQALEAENKTNKFDLNGINWVVGLINCIRNNLIMPIVYPESGSFEEMPSNIQSSEELKKEDKEQSEDKKDEKEQSEEKKEDKVQFKPALNVHGEFFQAEHESVRSLSKVVIASKDCDKLRRTICLQTLWLLLNDSQKKISVVCSEMNKAYYEEFFSRQRKIYNNLNNIRFYADFHSCAGGPHTLKKDGEIWFFDNEINGKLSEVIERAKELNAFWIFTSQNDIATTYKTDLESMNAKVSLLDQAESKSAEQQGLSMPWLSGTSLKFPMKLQCDLLVIGDIIGTNQLKPMYRFLKSNYATNQASHYQAESSHRHNHHYQQQQQQLNFSPAKKFKQVKFIRGGTIDNLRNSLKMHDSIQAQVILIHVGDEDLFKTRNSVTTIERVKELATLVKEYCPKSFIVLSTLMRRMSRTENSVTNEVNKGIVNFCKQNRETANFFYMLNSHFEPEYHTQEGRQLNNKGLRLFIDNFLFMVDYFLIKNNKQH